MTPTIQLHTLHSADGSATYQSPAHTILCGVNYPLEVQYRSKELPEDTYIEVNLRPHNAVAGVRERHVESIIKRLLHGIVLGEETPRCMLQVTLQVTDVSEDESLPGGVKSGGQGESYLGLLAGSINATVAGCLDAAVQMRGHAGAATVAIAKSGELVIWPNSRQVKQARSVHVFAYGRQGECLVTESEGDFGLEEFEAAEKLVRRVVLGAISAEEDDGEDISMTQSESEAGVSLLSTMRKAVETRIEKDGRWRES